MPKTATRFNAIASSYDALMPEHVRKFLLGRKTALTVGALKRHGITSARGLDLGCGTGWYLKSIMECGYAMTGIDNSAALVEEARNNNRNTGAVIEDGDILDLPFAAESFDFAYCINSLHHLRDDSQLRLALDEIHRVLRPDGLFVVHELNAYFLFRMYLNYIFPLTNRIDEFGGENWVMPRKLLNLDSFKTEEVFHYTFWPHITPKFMFRPCCRISDFLERTPLRKFSLHYMAVLKK